MKFIFLLSLLSFAIQPDTTPYLCTQVGNKSLRANYDNREKLVMYTEQEVMSVTEHEGIISVVVHITNLKPDKTPIEYILPYDITYEIRNGDVYIVVAATDHETKSTGNTSIPASMKVGDDYGPCILELPNTNSTNKSTVHYRKVVGQETITTPAGTFDCLILEQLTEIKVLGTKQQAISKTWYAKGVGDVKTEFYSTKGKLRSSVVLEEQ